MSHDHDHELSHDHGHEGLPGDRVDLARRGPLRVGIGGPVGSGKTALVAALCRSLSTSHSMAVVTNDIFTEEDAEALRRQGVLPDERIAAVATGCCPHTAIRDDVTANLDALEDLERRFPDLELILVESGGDNLTATFSYGLIDRQIFVIDVAGGDKVPRKGGPGVQRSDLLVVNKTDLAPFVGADLSIMVRDAAAQRGLRPVVFQSLTEDPAATEVTSWVIAQIAVRMVQGEVAGARVVAELGADGNTRLVELFAPAPIALRETGAGLFIVGSAQGLLGEDELELDVVVGPGAYLKMRSVAATVAYASSSARFDVTVRVESGGTLDWRLEPIIATARCGLSMTASVDLAPRAMLDWTEECILGRTGEEPGNVALSLRVERDGLPFLRHDIDVARDQWAWASPAVFGQHRAIGHRGLVPQNDDASGCETSGDGWAVLQLEGGGQLITGLASDIVGLRSAMALADDALTRAGA